MGDAAMVTPIMEDAEYRAIRALSHSGIRDLAVSPFRYWHRWINPAFVPEEPTPEMQLGSALHCAMLEPDEFNRRYACEFQPPEGCLVTIEDLREHLSFHGLKAKGTRKAEIIAQVQSATPSAPIYDVLAAEHNERHQGKLIFKAEDWKRIEGAVASLHSEPRVRELLSAGRAEVPIVADDPDSGIPLKGKLDYLRESGTIVDLKTFTQKRGKSIDKSITDAILYEGYHRQGYFYSLLRDIRDGHANPGTNGEVVLVFVESMEPFEVRIRALRPKTGGQPNLYWVRAMIECRGFIRAYAEYLERFGERPWRHAQDVSILCDEEMPGLAY